MNLIHREAETYRQRAAGSLRILHESAEYLPLGVASSFQHHPPFPLVIDKAEGLQVRDVDGNQYMDLHGGFGANAFGHAHPQIAAAMVRQAREGVHYAHPTPLLGRYARHLCQRFSMDQVRLCNSGTEATMDALRLARAFTGRQLIVRMEGSYHGHHDLVLVSMKPLLSAVGEPPRPGVWANSQGMSEGVMKEVIPLSFNDPDTLREVLHEEQVAAVILEPVLCNLGLVLPEGDYLQQVRRACTDTGTVLIWDQVKTGATLSWSGANQHYPDALPDLHCLGKAIGGGMPVGAYGGRKDIMDLISDGSVPGYGTFNGNPMTVAAGLAALEEVLVPEQYERLDGLQQQMADRLADLIAEHDLPWRAEGLGLKGGVFFTSGPVRDYRQYIVRTDRDAALAAWLFMANRGVLLAPGSDEQWTLPVQFEQDSADILVDLFAQFLTLFGRI